MSPDIVVRTRGLASGVLAASFWLSANAATAQSIQGTATYRERMTLPPPAVFEATLEDASRADAPALVLGNTRVASPGNPPIAFSIAYDPARIVPEHRYVVRGRIVLDGRPLFTSDAAIPVITQGSPTTIAMTLRRVIARPPTAPSSTTPLVGTYWKAIELAGTATPARDASREAHLQFQTDGRVSGSDSCNRTTGGYTLNGENLTFGRMAATQMACVDTGETERMFREALEETRRWRIVGDRLELFNAAGTRLAVFAVQARTPADAAGASPSRGVP